LSGKKDRIKEGSWPFPMRDKEGNIVKLKVKQIKTIKKHITEILPEAPF
jgi:hypothetical protein